MKDVQKLKRERQKVIDAMRVLTDAAEARDDKKFTTEERAQWDKFNGQVDEMRGEIEIAERMNTLELEGRDDPKPAPSGVPGGERRPTDWALVMRAAQTRDYSGLETRATGQGEAIPSDGGVLVTSDESTAIARRAFETGVLASRAQMQPIGAGSNSFTWNELDEDSRVNGSRNGGVLGYWVSESAAITASTAKFRKRRVDLEKAGVLVYATDELLEDATALDGFISNMVPSELAFQIDEAIVRGTGAGKPLGVLNSDAIISVAKETGQAADTVVYENVLKMRTRMPASSRGNAVWYINQDIEPELQTMALVVGTGGVPVYMPASGAAGSPYDTLFGRPVIPIEHCSTLGDLGDILFMDMSRYRLVNKGAVKKAVSIHVKFAEGEQAFRFTLRVGGAPIDAKPLTPFKGSSTTSPFVTLAARA